MKLSVYLQRHKLSANQFAKRLKSNPSYVSMLVHGRTWPGRKTAIRILQATDGLVTPNDFIGVDINTFKHKRAKASGEDGDNGRERQGGRASPT